MPAFSRRRIIQGTTLAAAGALGAAAFDRAAAADTTAAAPSAPGACPPPLGPVTVKPADSRYTELVHRGQKRYVASPGYIRVVGSTAQVVRAVQDAVRAGERIAVRSGGHCMEDWVDNPGVRVIIDMSGMTQVYYDPARDAFAIESGATLGEAYRRLFLGWGVTIPAGWCPHVAAGGHISGGGYGVLSRAYGLASDYLEAVEVVHVDASGTAHAVVASRDPSDPRHDLWWAHTGGGGGNFGVVTRYWLRNTGPKGTDPGALLPRAPATTIDFSCQWPWKALGLDRAKFTRLMRNHMDWCERHSAPGAPETRLYADLTVGRRATDLNLSQGQVFGPGADRLLDDYLAALGAGVGAPQNVVRTRKPWLTAALAGPSNSDDYRLKIKSAYLRSGFTDAQLGTIYDHFTAEQDPNLLIGSIGFATYGGRINTVAPAATAYPHRDTVMRLQYTTGWSDPSLDGKYDDWLRALYHDIYRTTHGVPDPKDGAYINYPDNDLADPRHNTSGIPWSTLYYKSNYPRLQKTKAHWDPKNIFTHTLGIEPPS